MNATVLVPAAKSEPLAGVERTVGLGSQASVAVTVKVMVAPVGLVVTTERSAGQAMVGQAELLEVQAGMPVAEPGGHLPEADMPDIDAAADPLGVAEPFRHVDEPSAIESGGVLEENQRTVRPLAQLRVQLAHRGQQAVRLRPHLTLVVDDQPGDAAREAVGELPDQGAVLPVQDVHAAVQVHHGQARTGGHELQDMLELIRRIGVYLGGRAHLGEAEAG